jgi:hypothetical protein
MVTPRVLTFPSIPIPENPMDHDYTNHIMPRKHRPAQRGPSAVPLLIVLALLCWALLLSVAAFAQSSESGAASQSSANVEVLTGAAAGVNIVNNGQKAGKDNRVYGEVATAPGLGGLALGGGAPCAYSPATAQVSIIGGGAGFGGMKLDEACSLIVLGAASGDKRAYTAASIVIAGRNPAACNAMVEAGMIAEGSCGRERRAGGRPDRSKPSTNEAEVSGDGTGAKCQLAGKVLTFRPTSAAARAAELVACKARWGV